MNALTTAMQIRVRRHQRGMALIYVSVIIVVMMGFVSMGVDLGRVQVAQGQLQMATDSAARYGAMGLQNIINGTSAAASNAETAGLDNSVDGSPLVIQSGDVQIGFWNTATHTFTIVSDPTTANAVQVTGVRAAARGTGIPTIFLQLLGRSSFDISATSTAMLTPGVSVNMTVPATSNPFLAGQPAGVSASNNNPHNDPDWSNGSPNPPSNLGGVHVEASPPQLSGITVSSGSTMTFDGINGGANNDYTFTNLYTADGDTTNLATNTVGNEHGIANMIAPINSLVGVFLDNTVPGSSADTDPTPADLDFSTDAERDFSTLSPKLQQLFFIGDGRDDNGQVQQFVVPPNATRLFIGTWDDYEWNNNIGSFNLTVHAPGSVTMVQ